MKDLKKHNLILASKSPRRQYLMKELGLDFEVHTKEVDESFPENLKAQEIPLYLCQKKADAFDEELTDNTIVITADTIVWINNQVLNKPENFDDAVRMLKLLSGKKHEVYTGVCLRSKLKTKTFYALTSVYFKELSQEEIEYYINNFNPYDKAGAYGAQEWIGYIAVEKIEGSYFNVMGLPVRELYEELLKF
ncbi:MAG: Maf family nucleotide pyrophosphatase [Bacteroidia bacterium]|nr:Maf family nucleotide pyrophosphatase [Bacteroidia bacterium]